MAAARMTTNRVGVRIGISLEYQVVVAVPSSLPSNAVLYKGFDDDDASDGQAPSANGQPGVPSAFACRIVCGSGGIEHRRSVEVGRVDVVVQHELLEPPGPRARMESASAADTGINQAMVTRPLTRPQ